MGRDYLANQRLGDQVHKTGKGHLQQPGTTSRSTAQGLPNLPRK